MWKQIETAPKDGTEFLATDARTERFYNVIYWEPEAPGGGRWGSVDGPTYSADAFTHWMPLPDQPTA